MLVPVVGVRAVDLEQRGQHVEAAGQVAGARQRIQNVPVGTMLAQIEQLVRISREFGREIATGKEAREILKIGVFYDTVEESLAANGFSPNRNGGNQGFLRKAA